MHRLVEVGALFESVTIFPSITPAATAAIITGEYPSETGIVGASWFDEGRREIAYFGDDFWVVAQKGFGEFLRGFLDHLNGDQLTASTLFEDVERAGRKAACLNYLVFKGTHKHKVQTPLLLRLLPGMPNTDVILGPSVLCLGDFVATRTLRGKPLVDKSGVLHRFGMDDAATGELLVEMAEDRAFPDFTCAYFANNDYRSHQVGPHAALEVVERVDRHLGRMFDTAGGMERMLQDTFVVITSDHGHCEVLDDEERAAIHLDRVLDEFRQAQLGKGWEQRDEIMICPNMRAAQIYFHNDSHSSLSRTVELALRDPRIDQAFWCAPGEGSRGKYAVATSRGRLDFWRAVAGEAGSRDAYGNVWAWRGDAAVLDFKSDGAHLLWGDYPNAFERIVGALDARHSASLWLTAKPGCEFEVRGTKAHVGGGSHGALHALESLCPVVVAGPRAVELPSSLRSVDLAPLCLELLGLPARRAVGAPRAA